MLDHWLREGLMLLGLNEPIADVAYQSVHPARLFFQDSPDFIHKRLGGGAARGVEAHTHWLHFPVELPSLDLGEQFKKGLFHYTLLNVSFQMRMYGVGPNERHQHGIKPMLLDIVGRVIGLRIDE